MDAKELLCAYQSGSRDFRGANLRNANLGGADLGGADLRNADLGGAHLGGADLGGAYLGGAYLGGADLRNANLGGANLGGAYLCNANLRNADLRNADLRNANLCNANLRNADLGKQWVIQGPARSDDYFFFFMRLTDEPCAKVRAGCRWLSMPQAREHWQKTRGGTPLGDETMAILDYLEVMAKIRGLT